ncbi:MAG: nif-specific transcriptional activator NifA [Desulfobulbaceae bacterium]|nr:nif-specific transcriptional activator NifA [Desulfobulbaceae bacterium]
MHTGEAGKNKDRSLSCETAVLEVEALHRIARLISTVVHLDSTLSDILQVLHETLQMERATLVLLDEKGRNLTIRASYGLSVEEEQRGVYSPQEGVVGRVFKSGCPFIVPDINSEPLFLNRTGARDRIKKSTISFIGVPIILKAEVVGVLTVDRLFGPEISFEEDVRFLTVLATLVAQFLSLHRAINRDRARLVNENRNLKAELHGRYSRHYIIGHSKPMQEVFWTIEKVAPSNATVLMTGESGTGKELVARAIHQSSRRKDNPFIKVNCAALPENLLESELFGHEKGAFTDAVISKPGRFELAHSGTLFLDEIGELPLALQAKILRVLQEKQFERVGGTRTLNADVRILAATNVELEEAVKMGCFRGDLFYRLNVVPISLPPLRRRAEDIPLLLDHFLQASNRRNDKNMRMSREFLDFLTRYPWPGNVRELQNLIERLVILAENEVIKVSDLPHSVLYYEASRLPEPPGNPFSRPVHEEVPDQERHSLRSLEDMERREVETALKRHGWVQARAARELGLTQRQIGYRIKKYGLTRPRMF